MSALAAATSVPRTMLSLLPALFARCHREVHAAGAALKRFDEFKSSLDAYLADPGALFAAEVERLREARTAADLDALAGRLTRAKTLARHPSLALRVATHCRTLVHQEASTGFAPAWRDCLGALRHELARRARGSLLTRAADPVAVEQVRIRLRRVEDFVERELRMDPATGRLPEFEMAYGFLTGTD